MGKPQYAVWDGIENFSFAQVVFLWCDYHPLDGLVSSFVNRGSHAWMAGTYPIHQTHPEVAEFEENLTTLIFSGRVKYFDENNPSDRKAFFIEGKLNEGKRSSKDFYDTFKQNRLPRRVLLELAQLLNQFPPFLFPDKRGDSSTDSNTPPYMIERGNENFSSELEAAVSASLALFYRGDRGKEPNMKSPKQQAIEWIKVNRPSIESEQAKERIASLINPDSAKSGGAPKTPKK